jgi:hypothetical protein
MQNAEAIACRDHNDSDDRRFLEERMEQIIKGNDVLSAML